MRLPVLEGSEEEESSVAPPLPPAGGAAAVAGGVVAGAGGAYPLSRFPRWLTLGYIEDKQCQLAVEMLSACKGMLS